MKSDDMFPTPEGGKGRLRAMLESIKEDHEKLVNHPIYKEGYDDGVQQATDKYAKITEALYHLYNIEARN